MAGETARLVFAALKDSDPEIDSLNIFSRAWLHRCSIDYAAEGLIIPLRSLESVSISISERILDVALDGLLNDDSEYEVSAEDEDEARGEATMKANYERNFTGVASLIQAFRNLKHLDIHHCRADPGYPIANIPNERLFQRIAALNNHNVLPGLEDCGLRGVFLTEDDLLAFLRGLSSPLRCFEMETVTMTLGTFGSVFELLTATSISISISADADSAGATPFPHLQYLYLDTL